MNITTYKCTKYHKCNQLIIKNCLTFTAFTLAEVLIVVGIIGIIAETTIPTLINNVQEEDYKVAYKKAYSTAYQAWLNAYNKDELTLCDNFSDWSGGTCNADNFEAFKSEMKVSKDCGTNTAYCWNMSGEQSWGGMYPTTNALAFIDASGIAWSKCHSTPAVEVLIDTNGDKKPNQYGKDRVILAFFYLKDHKNGVPTVELYPDFPNSDPEIMATYSTSEQLYRCPSMNTHPCYYTSWITGAK